MASHAESANRLTMRRRRIADIGLPAVNRIARRKAAHDPVARHLGDDGGSGDREAERIPFDDGLHGAGQRRSNAAIDEGDIGPNSEHRHRPGHRQQGRTQNVDAVYFGDAGRRDADPGCTAIGTTPQGAVAGFPIFDSEHFRIVEPVSKCFRKTPRVENHRCGDYWPGERSTSGLVNPADEPCAAPFDLEIRHPFPPPGLCHKGAVGTRAWRWLVYRAQLIAAIAIFLVFGHSPADAFDLFGVREVTVQFATQDGKPLANAEVRVFAPGEPKTPAATGRTDAEGKFVFAADRDGFWSADARGADQVARLMIRVGGDAQPQSGFSPFLVIGTLAILLAVAIWYRLLRARRRRPPPQPPIT